MDVLHPISNIHYVHADSVSTKESICFLIALHFISCLLIKLLKDLLGIAIIKDRDLQSVPNKVPAKTRIFQVITGYKGYCIRASCSVSSLCLACDRCLALMLND